MGFLYIERQTIPEYSRISHPFPHLVPHEIQHLNTSRPNITSSPRVPPPSLSSFKGLAHTDLAILEGISPLKKSKRCSRRQHLAIVRGPPKGNVADIRGKNPKFADNLVRRRGNFQYYRGNRAQDEGQMASNKGEYPKNKDNSLWTHLEMARNKGESPKYRGNLCLV